MFKAATMQFKASGSGIEFLRGRVEGKGNPWGKTLKVGKVEYKRGAIFPETTIGELTNAGVRVEIYPVQPVIEKVVKSGYKIPTLVLVERQREPREEVDLEASDDDAK